MSERFVVAIDGPGGAGKSTVSRLVAERLGFAHLDTGAFYRAATLAVLEAGAEPSDAAAVTAVAAGVRIDLRDGVTMLNGRNVSRDIRSDEVTEAVSTVSAHPALRRRMVEAQRRWVAEQAGRAVVEGRDIGSVVFPDAPVKIYLDADAAVRAARRSGESGAETGSVAEALRRRDALDSGRASSPLTATDDAVVIDTTHLEIYEVVDQVVSLIQNRLPG